MAFSIRDRNIFNTTVDQELLERLIAVRLQRAEQAQMFLEDGVELYLGNVIRYEGSGLSGLQTEDFLNRFRHASDIERIILSADCPESLKANRTFGFAIDIRLDSKTPENNILRVSGPDHDWVERTYTDLDKAIKQNANFHGYVKSNLSMLFIQLFAVVTMFSGSFWLGEKLSSFVQIENANIILFVFLLLIFSNIWTPVSLSINQNLDKLFPNALFINRINQGKITRFRTFTFGAATSLFAALTIYLVQLFLSQLPLTTN